MNVFADYNYVGSIKMSDDLDAVLNVMHEHPNASIRLWAARLGWIHPNGRPQIWRVEQALMSLALDKRVWNDGGKWKLCAP